MYATAVIGAGPIGLYSIFQAGMLELNICIIDSLEHVGGQCSALYPEKMIYDIPGIDLLKSQTLINKLKKQIKPFKFDIYTDETCLDISSYSNFWIIKTNKSIIQSKSIVIAAGAGTFKVKKPNIKNLRKFENKSIFYGINNQSIFKNKLVMIAGGGNSALDWSVMIAKKYTKHLYLLHRRNKFTASPKTKTKIENLTKEKKIILLLNCNIIKITGRNGLINRVYVKQNHNKKHFYNIDYLLPFLGMAMDMGPIIDWKLKFKNNSITVDPVNMQTNLKNIFAIGDICNYPGKLKLIVNGFSEASRAMYSIYKIINSCNTFYHRHSTIKGIPKNDNNS